MTKEEIKATTNMEDVIKAYGISIRNGMCRCPFHDDRKPSMKVYRDGAHCFTCARQWDVFAFVMDMEHCDFRTAYKKLGGDFSASKDSLYFDEMKKKYRDEIADKSDASMLEKSRRENKNLSRALMICLKADDCFEWGSSDWQYLKSMRGYIEELIDSGGYDWRVVEKILALYPGIDTAQGNREEKEKQYRIDITIKEVANG